MRALALAALLAGGCANHCAEVAAAKRALLAPVAVAPGPHVEIQLSVARANAFVAELLAARPLTIPIPRPDLGVLDFAIPELSARVRELHVLPAAAGRVHLALRVELADETAPITTAELELEVTPQLARAADGHPELVTTFESARVAGAPAQLTDESRAAIVAAVERWTAGHAPHRVSEMVAKRVLAHLDQLEAVVLHHLGEHAPLRVRLPDLPIASFALTTTADRLTLDLTSDLPVQQALAPEPPDLASELSVRISTSAAVAVANWTIDHGKAPQHYARDLKPRDDGEYRPYFAYAPADTHRPIKVYVVQERGGCSYFEVGLQLQLAVVGKELVATALDRYIEKVVASSPVEAVVWLQQLVRGAVDSSKHALAETALTIGEQHYTTRIVRASAAHDELAFELQLDEPAH